MATTVVTKGSIKVNGAVSASTTSTGTLYTAPSSGYAIVNLYSSNSATVQVGSRTVTTSGTGSGGFVCYIGPSQAISVSVNSSSATVSISGVEFANT